MSAAAEGAAPGRGPCLEGATSRPAAKSLPKGAKSYLKIMLQTAKRLGTVQRGRGAGGRVALPSAAAQPPPPPRYLSNKLCGGDFSLCQPPPAQGRRGRLKWPQHQWETLFLRRGRTHHTPNVHTTQHTGHPMSPHERAGEHPNPKPKRRRCQNNALKKWQEARVYF